MRPCRCLGFFQGSRGLDCSSAACGQLEESELLPKGGLGPRVRVSSTMRHLEASITGGLRTPIKQPVQMETEGHQFKAAIPEGFWGGGHPWPRWECRWFRLTPALLAWRALAALGRLPGVCTAQVRVGRSLEQGGGRSVGARCWVSKARAGQAGCSRSLRLQMPVGLDCWRTHDSIGQPIHTGTVSNLNLPPQKNFP